MERYAEHHAANLAELRDRVALASYQVDPQAVADAIVRRRWSVAIVPPAGLQPRQTSRRRTRARISRIARRGPHVGATALAV
jgi:hypothetical protein